MPSTIAIGACGKSRDQAAQHGRQQIGRHRRDHAEAQPTPAADARRASPSKKSSIEKSAGESAAPARRAPRPELVEAPLTRPPRSNRRRAERFASVLDGLLGKRRLRDRSKPPRRGRNGGGPRQHVEIAQLAQGEVQGTISGAYRSDQKMQLIGSMVSGRANPAPRSAARSPRGLAEEAVRSGERT